MHTTVFHNKSRSTWRARWVNPDGTRTSRTFATENEARGFDPDRDDTTPRRPGPFGFSATPEQRRERIRRSVIVDENGCWIWQRRIGNRGYGQLLIRRTSGSAQVSVLAHRLSYETFVGPIPEGLEIDHLCFVSSCVNPDHLEAVTTQENIRRRDARKAASA